MSSCFNGQSEDEPLSTLTPPLPDCARLVSLRTAQARHASELILFQQSIPFSSTPIPILTKCYILLKFYLAILSCCFSEGREGGGAPSRERPYLR